MNAQQYKQWTKPLRNNSPAASLVLAMNRGITALYYIAYPALIIVLALTNNVQLVNSVVFPVAGFVIVSALRCVLNRPRPYEAFHCAPVIPKNTTGKSFPSRHAYSSMVIAVTFLSVNLALGALMITLALLMAFVRVIGGVHYPSDVIVGMLLGGAFGAMALFL